MKYYAVKNGIKVGVFDNWNECEKQVKGYAGAEYKSFKKLEDDEAYLSFNNENIDDTFLGYSDENWESVLESLGFSEVKNPNGYECYDVLNDRGVPTWQYDTLEKKEKLYYFFAGAVYWKMHTEIRG